MMPVGEGKHSLSLLCSHDDLASLASLEIVSDDISQIRFCISYCFHYRVQQ